jgi:hypothetical protein
MLIRKRTEWDRQTEQGVQKLFTCTALPISLRVNLLAEAARETRFHARGCSVVVKEREAVVVDVKVKKKSPFLTCMPKKNVQFHAEPPAMPSSVSE